MLHFTRDLEKTELPLYSVKGHKEIINSIDGVGGLGIGEGAPEIVTGSRDGKISTFPLTSMILFSNRGLTKSVTQKSVN